MLNDVRYALRLLWRTPSYTLASVLILALGTGATTAIFRLVDAVLLSPLGLAEPARTVTLQIQTDGAVASRTFAYQQYRMLLDHGAAAFEGVAASSTRPRSVRVALAAGAGLADAVFVSEDYFAVLGVRPAAGRAFSASEHAPGAELSVIVSDAFWVGRLGADPTAIGRSIRIGDQTASIVGVMPRGFSGVMLGSPGELFVPLRAAPLLLPPANFWDDNVVTVSGGSYSPQSWLGVTARLRRGVSLVQAEQLLSTLPTVRLPGVQSTPTLRLVPTEDAALPQRTHADTTRFIGLLTAVVTLVLLVGCANLAGMVLARSEQRRGEIAVRLALGASRWALVRLFAVESLILSVCGGGGGLIVAAWMLTGMRTFVIPGGLNLDPLQLGLTMHVLLFAAGASLLTAVLSGLLPALLGSRVDVLAGLKTSTPSLTAGRSLARGTLVAAQIAMSLILVLGAGLFIRSWQLALRTDVGVDATRLAYARVSFSLARYDTVTTARFYEEVLRRVEAIPGVEGATVGDLPLAAGADSNRTFKIDGVERTFEDTLQFYGGPRYFATTGIPLVAGRAFGAQDREGALPVVVVNEAFARRAWPDGTAVGRRVTFRPLAHDLEVVGVARDGTYLTLGDEGRPALYLPWEQNRNWASSVGAVIVRSSSPAAATAVLRREIRAIDPNLPVIRTATLESRIEDLAMTQRIGASLLGWFSLVALTLSIVGVYGLIAHAAARRTKEIGIRMALGAESRDVVQLMMFRSLMPVVSGIAIGLAGAFLLSRLAERFLFGLHAHDPMIFAIATTGLCTAAGVATYIPARRASRIAPVTALRTE